MTKMSTTVNYRVPDGWYCNLSNEYHKDMPPETRCRFATQVRKGVFGCMMYNEALVVEQGYLVRKCKQCQKHIKKVSDTVQPIASPKQFAEAAIKKYQQTLTQMMTDGYPVDIASKLAYDFTIGGYTK